MLFTLFFCVIQTCDVDVDDTIAEIEQSAPYLVITGSPGTAASQVFICCEQQSFFESNSIKDGIIDLISTYFAFNITYPKFLNAVLLFFQHYVFNIKDKQPVPMSLLNLCRNLQKLD